MTPQSAGGPLVSFEPDKEITREWQIGTGGAGRRDRVKNRVVGWAAYHDDALET